MPMGQATFAEGGELLVSDEDTAIRYVPDSLTGPTATVDRQVVLITYTGLTVDRWPHYLPATAAQVAGVVRTLGLLAQSGMSVVQRTHGWQRRINLQPVVMRVYSHVCLCLCSTLNLWGGRWGHRGALERTHLGERGGFRPQALAERPG